MMKFILGKMFWVYWNSFKFKQFLKNIQKCKLPTQTKVLQFFDNHITNLPMNSSIQSSNLSSSLSDRSQNIKEEGIQSGRKEVDFKQLLGINGERLIQNNPQKKCNYPFNKKLTNRNQQLKQTAHKKFINKKVINQSQKMATNIRPHKCLKGKSNNREASFSDDSDDIKDFVFPKLRKQLRRKSSDKIPSQKLSSDQSHNSYNQTSDEKQQNSFNEVPIYMDNILEKKAADRIQQQRLKQDQDEKKKYQGTELQMDPTLQMEEQNSGGQLEANLQLMKETKFNLQSFINLDSVSNIDKQQSNSVNNKQLQAYTDQHKQPSNLPFRTFEIQKPLPQSSTFKTNPLRYKPQLSLFDELFPELVKFDQASEQDETKQNIFYEDEEEELDRKSMISSLRISSILNQIEQQDSEIKLESRLRDSKIQHPHFIKDKQEQKDQIKSTPTLQRSTGTHTNHSSISKVNHSQHDSQVKLQIKAAPNVKNQYKMSPSELTAFKQEQALIKRRIYRRSRSKKAKIQALIKSKHPNGIEIDLEKVAINDYFISAGANINEEEKGESGNVITGGAKNIFQKKDSSNLFMRVNTEMASNPASHNHCFTSLTTNVLINNPRSHIYQIRRSFHSSNFPYLTPSSTAVTTQQLLLPYHKHTQREINRLMRPKPEPKFVISNFDVYLKEKSRQKEYWIGKNDTIVRDGAEDHVKINLGYLDLEEVLYEMYLNSIISQEMFYEFMGSNGMHETKTFLKKLNSGQLSSFHFSRSRFTIADHRRASELLVLLYPHKYCIQTIQVFHQIIEHFLIDLYRLPSDEYKKLCTKIDSQVNNIFWVKLEQKFKGEIKGEIMEDHERETMFFKREVAGEGIGNDLLDYHNTIVIDNLFPSEQIPEFNLGGNKSGNPRNSKNHSKSNENKPDTQNGSKNSPQNISSKAFNNQKNNIFKSGINKKISALVSQNNQQSFTNFLNNQDINLNKQKDKNRSQLNDIKQYQQKKPQQPLSADVQVSIQKINVQRDFPSASKDKSNKFIYKDSDKQQTQKKQKHSNKKKNHKSKSKSKIKSKKPKHNNQRNQNQKHLEPIRTQIGQKPNPTIILNQQNQTKVNRVHQLQFVQQEKPHIPFKTSKQKVNFTIKLPNFKQTQIQFFQQQLQKGKITKTTLISLQNQKKLLGVNLEKIDTKNVNRSLRSKFKIDPNQKDNTNQTQSQKTNPLTEKIQPDIKFIITPQSLNQKLKKHIAQKPQIPQFQTNTIDAAKIISLSEKAILFEENLQAHQHSKKTQKKKKKKKSNHQPSIPIGQPSIKSLKDSQNDSVHELPQKTTLFEDQNSSLIKEEDIQSHSNKTSLSQSSSLIDSSMSSNSILQSSAFSFQFQSSSSSSSVSSDESSNQDHFAKVLKVKHIQKIQKEQKSKQKDIQNKYYKRVLKKNKKEKKNKKKSKKHRQKEKKKKKTKNIPSEQQENSKTQTPKVATKNNQPLQKKKSTNQQNLEKLRKKLRKIKKSKKIQKMIRKIQEYKKMKKLYKKEKSQQVFMRRVEGFSEGMDQLWKDKKTKNLTKNQTGKKDREESENDE